MFGIRKLASQDYKTIISWYPEENWTYGSQPNFTNAYISYASKELLITHPPQKRIYEKWYTVYISQCEGKSIWYGYYVVFGGIQKRQGVEQVWTASYLGQNIDNNEKHYKK